MINVEERKKIVLKQLEEVENDMVLLKERIHEMVIDLANVKTEDDAKVFDFTHDDLDAGLKHISLF